jgi:CheY-like chemotaxis protein
MKRLLLRAVLDIDDERRSVAHTLELSETRAFVATEEDLQPGAVIHLQLSFPRLVEPIHAVCNVIERAARGGPGESAGVLLTLEFEDSAERARLSHLLHALDEAAPATADQRDYRVLLVEDSKLIRDMFAFGIRKYFQGRESTLVVDHAGDGASAWTMLNDSAYDLAIVDYYLPMLDGANLVKRMRSSPKLRDVPIVAISVGGADAREATLAAGADLFLDKPLGLRDLFSTLERLNCQGPAR